MPNPSNRKARYRHRRRGDIVIGWMRARRGVQSCTPLVSTDRLGTRAPGLKRPSIAIAHAGVDDEKMPSQPTKPIHAQAWCGLHVIQTERDRGCRDKDAERHQCPGDHADRAELASATSLLAHDSDL